MLRRTGWPALAIAFAVFVAIPLLFGGCGGDGSDSVSAEEASRPPLAAGIEAAEDDSASVEADEADAADVSVEPSETTEDPLDDVPAPDGEMVVTFLDVGQADAALVQTDGHAMLIDGGNRADSQFIYSYLKEHEVGYLDVMVATHPHEDHIGGLAGALNYAAVGAVYSPVISYDSDVFADFAKYVAAQDGSITIPQAGGTFALGDATVRILAPVRSYTDPNDMSIVLKVTFGETSFLFTGDAERTAESDILESGCDLSATVLKVGHHGSDSSTSYPFLRAVMPQAAVISCGTGNDYGHPHEDLLSRLRDADVTVYRTDMQGTITCTSDGKTVSFATEKNADAQTNPTVSEKTEADAESATPAATASAAEGAAYIGNINSYKFHLPSCRTLPMEKNRVYFNTRDEAVNAGFDPCGNCRP
jgi:competence protein ComEC